MVILVDWLALRDLDLRALLIIINIVGKSFSSLLRQFLLYHFIYSWLYEPNDLLMCYNPSCLAEVLLSQILAQEYHSIDI